MGGGSLNVGCADAAPLTPLSLTGGTVGCADGDPAPLGDAELVDALPMRRAIAVDATAVSVSSFLFAVMN